MNYYVVWKKRGWLKLKEDVFSPRIFSLEEAKTEIERMRKETGEEFEILDESFTEVKDAENDN